MRISHFLALIALPLSVQAQQPVERITYLQLGEPATVNRTGVNVRNSIYFGETERLYRQTTASGTEYDWFSTPPKEGWERVDFKGVPALRLVQKKADGTKKHMDFCSMRFMNYDNIVIVAAQYVSDLPTVTNLTLPLLQQHQTANLAFLPVDEHLAYAFSLNPSAGELEPQLSVGYVARDRVIFTDAIPHLKLVAKPASKKPLKWVANTTGDVAHYEAIVGLPGLTITDGAASIDLRRVDLAQLLKQLKKYQLMQSTEAIRCDFLSPSGEWYPFSTDVYTDTTRVRLSDTLPNL